jgi:hypothetical protein
MLKCTHVILKLLQQEVPNDGYCKLKHVAPCDRALKCCVGAHFHLFVYDTEKHKGTYQNK